MNHQQVPAAELAGRWGTLSDRFLQAAGCLPAASELAVPRRELLARAVEYRLKAYLCACRGGAPESRDLARLTLLARHGGLTLTGRQREGIESVAQPERGDSGAEPIGDLVAEICRAISAQMPGLE